MSCHPDDVGSDGQKICDYRVDLGRASALRICPIFFCGVVISLALTRSPFTVARVYGVDLLGAAMGCLGALELLNLTDGPSAFLWVSAVMAAVALFFAASAIGRSPEGDALVLGHQRRGRCARFDCRNRHKSCRRDHRNHDLGSDVLRFADSDFANFDPKRISGFG